MERLPLLANAGQENAENIIAKNNRKEAAGNLAASFFYGDFADERRRILYFI